MRLLTFGYRQSDTALADLQRWAAQGAVIVDIRYRAGSRFKPEFNKGRLIELFGGSYWRIQEFGNVNYNKPNEPIELLNIEEGFQRLNLCMSYVEVMTGKKPDALILLCACPDPAFCHRYALADLLIERGYAGSVRHLGPGGEL